MCLAEIVVLPHLVSKLHHVTSYRQVYPFLWYVYMYRWYRKLCKSDSEPGPVQLSAQTQVTPYILRMAWNGRPLYRHKSLGWGYLVDPEDTAVREDKESEEENLLDELEENDDEE